MMMVEEEKEEAPLVYIRKEPLLTPGRCEELIERSGILKEICCGATRLEIAARDVHDMLAHELLTQIRETARKEVTEFYGITSPTYHDYTMFSNLQGGDHHTTHADAEQWDKVKQDWVPNHTPQRTCTAMVYLNEEGEGKDFEGGLLVFPRLKEWITPKPGLMVGFLTDHRFLHQTFPVTRGNRLALSIWMTDKKSKEERW